MHNTTSRTTIAQCPGNFSR